MRRSSMGDQVTPSSGAFSGASYLFPVRVYYEDTDLSGIVYHSNYLKYCERARSELLTTLGIDQRAVQEEGGGHYAVSEANIRWLRPAKLGDLLTVDTQAEELKAASARLRQRISRGDELLAEVFLRVGFVGPDGRPRRQPQAWRDAFARVSPEKAPE